VTLPHAAEQEKATRNAHGSAPNMNAIIRQHLIDPEICIQCNACESICPEAAISHDSRRYVVDPAKCTTSMACIANCPTGAIDNWRTVPVARAYSVQEQFGWDALPAEWTAVQLAAAGLGAEKAPEVGTDGASKPAAAIHDHPSSDARMGATLPPWSAAHPFTNLYRAGNPVTATVTGNMRVTELGQEYDTHQIVLDMGRTPFPLLEGQSIGVVPPGHDASGRPHHARQYSVSSARDGERQGFNNLSLTVKRVLEDRQGNPVHGVASNYLCDLKVGDTVQVIGPFGASFLMPNHPGSHIVMICTGTGSAPMRAMLHWRNRQRIAGNSPGGRLMLFFGARTRKELPFFGRLNNLPKDFLDLNLAFSREADQPKRYVQDLMRERSADLAALLADPDSHFYVCGLRSMEEGVVLALRDIAEQAGLRWETLGQALKREGRLHLETY